MGSRYDWPDEIPDEAIREAFARADVVQFSARSNNCIKYQSIAFGNLGWWLSLTRVLLLVSITPQMLRPVFSTEGELPDDIGSYEELGSFPLSRKPFQELARVLGKSVEVLREDGASGYHYHLFTARPSGEVEIVEVVKGT